MSYDAMHRLQQLSDHLRAVSRGQAASSQAVWDRLSFLELRIAAIEAALNLAPPAPPRQVAEDPVAALEQMAEPTDPLADPLETYDPTLEAPTPLQPITAEQVVGPAASVPGQPPAPMARTHAASDPWPPAAPIQLPPGVDLGASNNDHSVDTAGKSP